LKPADDFSPIAEQGELEVEGGLFSRLKRRRELAPIAPGFVRVLLDGDGNPIDQQTAGQKYWSRARGWVKVDVRSHPLEYTIQFPDPTGLAGFAAELLVSARVSEPAGAVAEGADSVEDLLRPSLQKAVRKAHGKATQVNESENSVNILNQLRLNATENLETLLGDLDDLPHWLSAKVTAVTVELDEATARHREELVGKLRAVAVFDADGQSGAAKARNELAVLKIWEEGLAGRLADPERRALMRLAADPSKDNIDVVAAEFNQLDAEKRAAVLGFFRLAVEEGHFPEDEGLLSAFRQMESQMAKPQGELGGGAPEQVEAPKDEPVEVVDAETVETDPGPESDDSGDTDWGK
jgi:hypothetical protein